MDLTNELVEHPVFGTGSVISQDNRRITIQFSEEAEEKRFIYPDAFENCLNMCNPAAAQKTWKNAPLAAPRRKFAVITKQPKVKAKKNPKKKNSEVNNG